jgi:hypothetical protein
MISLTLPRRFLVLAALLFWQGGFVFYASVVVPVAQAQIGHRTQGFITAEVTNFLNLAGALALPLLLWDLAVLKDRSALRRRLLWTSWIGMAVTLAALAALHLALVDLMVYEGRLLTDTAHYVVLHRWYLWISTVQWGFAVVYGALTLVAWRSADHS